MCAGLTSASQAGGEHVKAPTIQSGTSVKATSPFNERLDTLEGDIDNDIIWLAMERPGRPYIMPFIRKFPFDLLSHFPSKRRSAYSVVG